MIPAGAGATLCQVAATMGQAVDAAIARHGETYPGSEVHSVRCSESDLPSNTWRVEICSAHFSVPLIYYMPMGGGR